MFLQAGKEWAQAPAELSFCSCPPPPLPTLPWWSRIQVQWTLDNPDPINPNCIPYCACAKLYVIINNIELWTFHKPGVPKQLQWYGGREGEEEKSTHESLTIEEKIELLDQIGKKSYNLLSEQ